jgi:hypothetical protein
MARVVFSLTTVQVKTLCLVAARGETGSTRRDHTAALTEKGWIVSAGERWKLTSAGLAIVKMIRALKLHKASQASGPEHGGP